MEHKYTHNDFFKPTECPSDALLLSYVKGTINHNDKRLVELHLVDCEMCHDMVEGYQKMDATKISSNIKSIEIKIDEAVANQSNRKAASSTFKWYYAAAAILLIGLTGILYQFYFKSINQTQVADLPKPLGTEKIISVDNTKENEKLPAKEPSVLEEDKIKTIIPQAAPVANESTIKTAELAESSDREEPIMEITASDDVKEMAASEKPGNVGIESAKSLSNITSGNVSNEINATTPDNSFSFSPPTTANGEVTIQTYSSPNTTFDALSPNAVMETKKQNSDKKVASESNRKAKFKSPKAIAAEPITKTEESLEKEKVDQVSVESDSELQSAKQLFQQKNYIEAIPKFASYVKKHPKDCDAINALAQSYEMSNKIIEAIHNFSKLSQLKCGKLSDSAKLKLAELYLKNKQPNEAKLVLQKAMQSQYLDIAEQAKKELEKL